jgi:hypothetical protein
MAASGAGRAGVRVRLQKASIAALGGSPQPTSPAFPQFSPIRGRQESKPQDNARYRNRRGQLVPGGGDVALEVCQPPLGIGRPGDRSERGEPFVVSAMCIGKGAPGRFGGSVQLGVVGNWLVGVGVGGPATGDEPIGQVGLDVGPTPDLRSDRPSTTSASAPAGCTSAANQPPINTSTFELGPRTLP